MIRDLAYEALSRAFWATMGTLARLALWALGPEPVSHCGSAKCESDAPRASRTTPMPIAPEARVCSVCHDAPILVGTVCYDCANACNRCGQPTPGELCASCWWSSATIGGVAVSPAEARAPLNAGKYGPWRRAPGCTCDASVLDHETSGRFAHLRTCALLSEDRPAEDRPAAAAQGAHHSKPTHLRRLRSDETHCGIRVPQGTRVDYTGDVEFFMREANRCPTCETAADVADPRGLAHEVAEALDARGLRASAGTTRMVEPDVALRLLSPIALAVLPADLRARVERYRAAVGAS